MLCTERVRRTLEFMRERFAGVDYFRDRPADLAYRWEHSLRVAEVGGEIARAEGMDEEAMTVACLLHDIAYSQTWPDDYQWGNHGRDGARIARPFVESLGFAPEVVEDICYGIAIHVDDKADFPGTLTRFALTVGDADNIDRFGPFRVYELLWRKGFYDMPLAERIHWLEGVPASLDRCAAVEMATPTARRLWEDRIRFQRNFYSRLLEQMRAGQWDKEESV